MSGGAADASVRGGLLSFDLGDGVSLHLNPRDDLKTVRVDIFAAERLCAGRNTRFALVARILSRGTQQFPDLLRLNRFLDGLYGADFGVDVEQFGDHQALHLSLEILDERFIPGQEDLHSRALGFLHEALRRPLMDDGASAAGALAQEKTALQAVIASQLNDKLAFAQRRCIELMCAGEAYALSPLGDTRDLAGIRAGELVGFYFDVLRRNPIDVYVSGRVDTSFWRERWSSFFDWARKPADPERRPRRPAVRRQPTGRRVFESLESSQGRLVLGYRTRTRVADPDYPALLLLNQIWGGDGHSRLFQVVRERRGLCYHIGSHLEAMCGLLLVSAGIEPGDYEAVLECAARELEALRRGALPEGELAAARTMISSRLSQLDEDPAVLVGFHFRQRLAGAGGGPQELLARVEQVSELDVARVARNVRLDTAYLAHPVSWRPGEGRP